jgi:hypothetical protein
MMMKDCAERFVLAVGDYQEIRARVPAGYTLQTDPIDRPLMLVNGMRCELSFDGGTSYESGAFSLIAPEVQSPDGQGCSSDVPGVGTVKGDAAPICNLYILEWYTDNQHLAEWANRGTDAPEAVYLPSGLDFEQQAPDPTKAGAPFELRTPELSWDAVVRPVPAAPLALHVGIWWDSPDGTKRVKITVDPRDQIQSYGAVDGPITAAPGSEAAALFGGTTLTPIAGTTPAGPAPLWTSSAYREVRKL